MANRALVTGGCGFIGSHLIKLLIEKYDFQILNLDKLTYASDATALEDFFSHPSYSFIQGDICDTEVLVKAIKDIRPHVVFHLAAESHVDRSIECANPFIQTNIIGTYVLLESLSKLLENNLLPKHFRFIHVSTDEVYGSLGFVDKPTKESAPYNPSSPYSASKASSDLLVKAWIKTYRFPALITHCTNNYGEFQHDEKLIPTLIRTALQNKPIPIYGTGKNIRDWLYVKDHCEALFAVFQRGKIGRTYNISASQEVTNNEIANIICTWLDDAYPREDKKSYLQQITYVQDRLGHDLRYSLDNRKIVQELFWVPSFSFQEGLNKTLAWYLEKYQSELPVGSYTPLKSS